MRRLSFRCPWLVVLLALPMLACAGTPPAPSKPASAAETLRLQRLGSLARAWGAVRYLHPALATSDIDWDRALVDAIPRVDAARTPAQFHAAIGGMLAALHDPATRVVASATVQPKPAADAKAATDGPPFARRDGELLRIDLARMAQAGDDAGSWWMAMKLLDPLAQLAPGARAWVIDARAQREPSEDGSSRVLIAELYKRFGNQPIVLGGQHYRRYDGYPPQTGNPSSGGYSSGMVTDSATSMPGTASAPLPPIIILANARTAIPPEWLAALQANGYARILGEDELGGLDATPFAIELPEGLKLQVRTTELVGTDGSLGVREDARVAPADVDAAIAQKLAQWGPPRAAAGTGSKAVAYVRPDIDRPYAEMRFPSREYRLLALFRFWNVVEHFYPYKPLLAATWDSVLQRYIPDFEADRDAADYQLSVRRLATELHDSHTGVQGDVSESNARRFTGGSYPAVRVAWIEDQTVVAELLEQGTGLRLGDVLLSIDGVPVAQVREERARYQPASTEQALQRDINRSLLRGAKDSEAKLDVRGVDGTTRTVAVKRALDATDPRLEPWMPQTRTRPVYELLPNGVGYVDLARLTPAQVDAMFEAIAPARAAIFDMRGYPNGTAWDIAPRLGSRVAPVAAQFRRKSFTARDGDADMADSDFMFVQRVPKSDRPRWSGKVVMLIDGWSQSQSEHTGMFFEAATPTTFIGSPTAGANGDVTQMMLPGKLAVSFTGHDVRHANGRQLQRLGLQPDVLVKPTIAGIARGDDEVLVAAQAWLNEHGYTN